MSAAHPRKRGRERTTQAERGWLDWADVGRFRGVGGHGRAILRDRRDSLWHCRRTMTTAKQAGGEQLDNKVSQNPFLRAEWLRHRTSLPICITSHSTETIATIALVRPRLSSAIETLPSPMEWTMRAHRDRRSFATWRARTLDSIRRWAFGHAAALLWIAAGCSWTPRRLKLS